MNEKLYIIIHATRVNKENLVCVACVVVCQSLFHKKKEVSLSVVAPDAHIALIVV